MNKNTDKAIQLTLSFWNHINPSFAKKYDGIKYDSTILCNAAAKIGHLK